MAVVAYYVFLALPFLKHHLHCSTAPLVLLLCDHAVFSRHGVLSRHRHQFETLAGYVTRTPQKSQAQITKSSWLHKRIGLRPL